MFQDLTGQRVGPYSLLEKVGAGGVGLVYRARDPYNGGHVAVKVVTGAAAKDDSYQHRFQREVEVASRLDHPHILPVLNYGYYDGLLYMVMPFVEGPTLGNYLGRVKALSPREVHIIAEQIGAALDYAHGQGVVHRDVKPHNIMVLDEGVYCLTDFGLVKLSSESITRLTLPGDVIGTPAYMSPEQASGDLLDSRSDIYSFGLVLYESLLGHLPYNADSPMTMISRHTNACPLAPHEISRDFPPSLEEVLLKTLEKDPDKRYQTAGEVAEEMAARVEELPGDLLDSRLVTREQISAADRLANEPYRPPVPTIVLQKGRRQRRLRSFLAVAALLVLLVAGTFGGLQIIQPLQERAVYAEQTAEALLSQTPVVIVQYVTQMVTNAAGEIVYIEVEVTQFVTAAPDGASGGADEQGQPGGAGDENRATSTPTPTLTPMPTPKPSGAPPEVVDPGHAPPPSAGDAADGDNESGKPEDKPTSTKPPPPPPTKVPATNIPVTKVPAAVTTFPLGTVDSQDGTQQAADEGEGETEDGGEESVETKEEEEEKKEEKQETKEEKKEKKEKKEKEKEKVKEKVKEKEEKAKEEKVKEEKVKEAKNE